MLACATTLRSPPYLAASSASRGRELGLNLLNDFLDYLDLFDDFLLDSDFLDLDF